jgi:CHAT domain-containing protein
LYHFNDKSLSLWSRLSRYVWCIGLLFLIPLSDVNLGTPASAYKHARELFLRGNLEKSQRNSEHDYLRFRHSDPTWALKFLVLEAEAMVWRGMYQDALLAIASRQPSPEEIESRIRQLTIEGIALAGMQQFSGAKLALGNAETLCLSTPADVCGEVIGARGVLAIKEGRFEESQHLLLECRQFAQTHSDRWLEATALLNLGAVALKQEKYDEAREWSSAAYSVAAPFGADDLAQRASGNQGWAYYRLGDSERALKLFINAEKQAATIGDLGIQVSWLGTIGDVYAATGRFSQAEEAYLEALALAKKINSTENIVNALVVLAKVYVDSGDADKASPYLQRAYAMALKSGSREDMMDTIAIQMQSAALKGDAARAKQLLQQVEAAPESQTSMKWASELAMARLYESQGQVAAAQGEYTTALDTFESARAQLKHEDSQLPFVANATRIYDDYIHFLVQQGKVEEALLAADQSRARTLSQGLGIAVNQRISAALAPRAVARKAGATLLFYWLGEKQSYLWAVTAEKVALFPLPPQAEITPMIERYSKTLLGPEDPLEAANVDGQALYEMLVKPAAKLLRANAPVMVLADGPLCKLNFETLIVGPENAPVSKSKSSHEFRSSNAAAHYWIEDATIMSAPSLVMLAAAHPVGRSRGNLLLLGDAVQPDASYPQLPYAAVEMKQVQRHFAMGERAIFAREQATPAKYLGSDPRQYAYIHFVSHGVASLTDPLDSAIILSRGSSGEDSFKLYAREIMQHPIDARLVTISACYGSGTRSYAGEGLVGLSWAFLHAGAHNAIGALWEASDRSTAQLMDTLYQGLEEGEAPGAALRRAKLSLLHSRSNFRKPFYWAPFQIYTRL